MGKPSGPQSPNYTQAAGATAAQNRVSQYTPYGNSVYTTSGTDQYGNPEHIRQDISLAPQTQQALDSQLALSSGLGDIAQGQLPGVEQQYSQPMDLSSVQQVSDKAYDTLKARLDPDWQQRESMQKTQLANQGLVPGGEAYDNAMRTFNQGRNDAYQNANLASIQLMPQTYQLASSQYMQPLNTLNALRTGAQVQNPQFGSTPQGANYLTAQQAQGLFDVNKYGVQAGGYNNMMGGLFGLGAAYLGS